MAQKGLGWTTLVLGILVLLVPWVLGGNLQGLQWTETVLGIITGIVGIWLLK